MKTIATQVGSVTSRVLALDALRGLTVLGMIVVNTAGFLHEDRGFPAYATLLHSAWAGFTLADAVFPAFILMVGVSVACSLAKVRAAEGAGRGRAFRTISMRSLRLLTVGFVLSNLYWLQTPDDGHVRIFGVLQRIGLVYFACAILYLTTGFRARLALAVGILVLYWPLTLLPAPDGPAQLQVAGANLVSWTERAWLGVHIYVHGPRGFDPEGLLSTLPAIAQGLIGVAVGEWMIARGPSIATAKTLAWIGAALTAAGVCWCLVYPPIKAIWTSSFVLLSSGPALMALGLLYWLLDLKGLRPTGYAVIMAFGVNAITAYVLHEIGSVVLEASPFRRAYEVSTHILPSNAAALVPVAIFTVMVWAPVGWFYHKRWIVKI